jgi:hypothetical protein
MSTGAGSVVLAIVRGDVPVEPDRDTARSWAVQELSGREYQAARPSLLTRLMSWVAEQLSKLPVPHTPGSRFGLLVVVLVAVAAVLYAVQRSGGLRRQTRVAAESVFGDRALTAADHRAAAETAERGQDWATAVVERFRAVARELEEHAVLVPQPGRTADEVAVDAGTWLPELADRLRRAARLFDDVRYGDRPVSADAAGTLRDLDGAVRRAKPVAGAVAVTGGPVPPS